jgi:hypothetical protein
LSVTDFYRIFRRFKHNQAIRMRSAAPVAAGGAEKW